MTRRIGFALAVIYVAALIGCGGQSSPSAPSTASLAGTWSGSASDSSGPGQITWTLAGSGSSFSGALTMRDTSTGVTGRGTVTVTQSGSSIHFSMTVPAGGFDSPYQSCTVDVSGDGAVAGTITGTYTGTSSCSGAITSGQLTLSRQ